MTEEEEERGRVEIWLQWREEWRHGPRKTPSERYKVNVKDKGLVILGEIRPLERQALGKRDLSLKLKLSYTFSAQFLCFLQ